ncbi:V-type ATP synthase subunit I [Candidatus Soleaferrea massiliensis]|uniref:V-type ATP synthase subunit I n=1 Tax=Candidatus Soleaferrea massiliensis TaxID=1470354 RepID=UPI00058F0456|nr:V-type ATPase 116kDa subunit family protein [Candidatus Soleaferrea massiliensis]
MSIEKMTLVNIVGQRRDLDAALLQCAASGIFHPETIPVSPKLGDKFKKLSEDNPYADMLKRVVDILIMSGVKPAYRDYSSLSLDRENMDDFIRDFTGRLNAYPQKIGALSEEIAQQQQALIQLEHVMSLDVDFDAIFACQYLKVRFGRIPTESYEKLSFYKERPFIFQSFDHDADYHWCVYFAPSEEIDMVDNMFSSLFFERIRIPDYAHGTPSEAKAYIKQCLEDENAKKEALEKERDKLIAEHSELILQIYSKLKCISDSLKLKKYVLVMTGEDTVVETFYMTGFIPQCEEAAFKEAFGALDSVDIIYQPPEIDRRFKVPVKLKNNRFFRPYEQFVEMYGVPSYKGIDPTPFLAITYTILFGIMFGDLGQGILISIIGWIMFKWKKMNLGKIMMRIGVSSAVFGCLYGSVFGFEHVLDPVYKALFGLDEKPIEPLQPDMINIILLSAIALGVVLILSSMIFNIILNFKQKEYGKALFGQNGIAGLVFYGSVITAAVLMMMFNINILTPAFILPCVVLPILLIFLCEPLSRAIKKHKLEKPEDGIGSFILESFFECFEVVLSFVSNTVSFLRVGGFVLSHAGMMLVVFTLADMAGPVAYIPVVIIGNLFVMALEGLIAGIQVLRLEFYEMFSRFFDGDGKEYEPVTISYELNEEN